MCLASRCLAISIHVRISSLCIFSACPIDIYWRLYQYVDKPHINVSAKCGILVITYELHSTVLFGHSIRISMPLFRVQTNFLLIPWISRVCSQLRETAVWLIVCTLVIRLQRDLFKLTSFAWDHADQMKLYLQCDTIWNSIQKRIPLNSWLVTGKICSDFSHMQGNVAYCGM